MGCQQSKVADDAQVTTTTNGQQKADLLIDQHGRNGSGQLMVPRCSLTTEPEPLLKLDPRSPLKSRQIFKLKQSWKGIRRHMEETGVEMFVRLFHSNGELKSMFHAFKHLESDDDMRSDQAVENHATLVMTTLDDAITHIDNYDYVSEVLHKVGGSHIRFEGFSSDNFMKIREPFLDAVKVTLGDRYTENMETIYKIAISFILKTMSEGMEEAHKKKAQAQALAQQNKEQPKEQPQEQPQEQLQEQPQERPQEEEQEQDNS